MGTGFLSNLKNILMNNEKQYTLDTKQSCLYNGCYLNHSERYIVAFRSTKRGVKVYFNQEDIQFSGTLIRT